MLIVLLCIVIGIMATVSRGKSSTTTQDVAGLDRRVSLLEQRLYMLESSMNRLQTYVTSQRSPVSQPSNDREISLLQEEVQRLNLRLAEVECGLIKLDERTTTPARRSSAPKSTDPCRQNADAPLRLQSRP
jgi:predicted RNase H-like nuclease (RuvC/YqgF family)